MPPLPRTSQSTLAALFNMSWTKSHGHNIQDIVLHQQLPRKGTTVQESALVHLRPTNSSPPQNETTRKTPTPDFLPGLDRSSKPRTRLQLSQLGAYTSTRESIQSSICSTLRKPHNNLSICPNTHNPNHTGTPATRNIQRRRLHRVTTTQKGIPLPLAPDHPENQRFLVASNSSEFCNRPPNSGHETTGPHPHDSYQASRVSDDGTTLKLPDRNTNRRPILLERPSPQFNSPCQTREDVATCSAAPDSCLSKPGQPTGSSMAPNDPLRRHPQPPPQTSPPPPLRRTKTTAKDGFSSFRFSR